LRNMQPSFASSPYEPGLMRQPSSKYTTTAFETLLRLQLHKLLHNQASFRSISHGRLDLVNKWTMSERQIRPLTSQVGLDNDADLRAILEEMKKDLDPRDRDPLEEMLEGLREIIFQLSRWKRISARIDVSDAEWLGILQGIAEYLVTPEQEMLESAVLQVAAVLTNRTLRLQEWDIMTMEHKKTLQSNTPLGQQLQYVANNPKNGLPEIFVKRK
jgi:hypothetical protein